MQQLDLTFGLFALLILQDLAFKKRLRYNEVCRLQCQSETCFRMAHFKNGTQSQSETCFRMAHFRTACYASNVLGLVSRIGSKLRYMFIY